MLQFNNYKMQSERELNENEKETKLLKEKLQRLESERRNLAKKVNYVKMFEKSIKYSDEHKPTFKWIKSEWETHAWSDNMPMLRYELKLVSYEFTITIKERKDLKVWKYEVTANGRRDEPSDSLMYHGGGSNNNYNYFKNYFGKWVYNHETSKGSHVPNDRPFSQKFKTLKDAEAWAKEWIVQINESHKDIIDLEYAYFKQAKAEYGKDKVLVTTHEFNQWRAIKELASIIPEVDSIEDPNKAMNTLVIKGINVKEHITNLIEKYKFNATILA